MGKLWGGRFSEEPAPELLAFTESLSFDRVLARDDCAVLAAHARALGRAGVMSVHDAERIAGTLDQIAIDIEKGSIAFRSEDEDIHTVVERALLERLPELAGKVRAGLSRNDRVVTALRLWLLREGANVLTGVAGLIDTLIRRAREHRETILPGYTHLQRAQPVRLAHHLLAHAFSFERDARRLYNALACADSSPLGAGAVAGSTLGIDASAAADELGFTDVMPNSIDAVAARDFVAEFLTAAAIFGVHLSRLAEEIVLWTSAEFAYAELADAHTTGSSLMPQKKNPDVAELVRGKAGRLTGNAMSLLVTLKGLPLAYNRDLQEDKEPLFDTVRTLRVLLPALSAAMRELRFNEAAMETAAADESLLATDAAEELVRRGTPFREAHELVGTAFARARREGMPLAAVIKEQLGIDLPDVKASMEARPSPGPSKASLDEQFARIDEALQGIRRAFG